MDASEIQSALRRLTVLGRVLYVAAHPDDENTALLAYWANGAGYDAGYLSITRGDGGQNLLGPELRDALGVIRTQELLAARRIDHGQQFFTRANDFGFSKSADETLRFWDRDKILADVVWTIRRFRPDVIVTRFEAGDQQTHGHHTASALLAGEAFRAAADPTRFPEQLADVGPWQPKRLVWNTSRFFFAARNLPFDPTGLASVEVGGFLPLLGKTPLEIAAASRSMHKSQGFGVGVERGPRREYFRWTDGATLGENDDLFDGVDTTWSRVPGAEAIAVELRKVLADFRPDDPARSVPDLLAIHRQVAFLFEGEPWPETKLAELDEVIAACLGLHLAAVTERPTVRPGEALAMSVEAVNRSPLPVTLRSLRLPVTGEIVEVNTTLTRDALVTRKLAPRLPADLPFSQPYWLREPGTVGTFTVNDQTLIGRPENPPAFPVEAVLDVAGAEMVYALTPRFREVDPVAGERSEPLVIVPPAFVELPRPVFVFGDARPKTFDVRVVPSAGDFTGELALEAPPGWTVEPRAFPLALRGVEAKSFPVTLTPPTDPRAPAGTLRAVLVSGDGQRHPAHGRQAIRYPHLDPQTLLPPAEARLVRADIQNRARRVGYLPGAGDALPEGLREIGAEVRMMDPDAVWAADLAGLDAVVLGVRALNVQPAARLAAWAPALRAYAEGGGTVLVQYNTLPVVTTGFLPFPLRVGRERVTDETAAVTLLAPDDPLLNAPNHLDAADFDGWVQERGLYFAESWDPAWTPLLASHDPGERDLAGGLLVARCGRGRYVYTGLSLFRQLPAGVPGAYRLLANLLSPGGPPP